MHSLMLRLCFLIIPLFFFHSFNRYLQAHLLEFDYICITIPFSVIKATTPNDSLQIFLLKKAFISWHSDRDSNRNIFGVLSCMHKTGYLKCMFPFPGRSAEGTWVQKVMKLQSPSLMSLIWYGDAHCTRFFSRNPVCLLTDLWMMKPSDCTNQIFWTTWQISSAYGHLRAVHFWANICDFLRT